MGPRTHLAFSRIVCLAICIAFLASCVISRHPAGIAASTAPVSSNYTSLGAVEDRTCNYLILFIIPLFSKDPTYQLIDELTKAKGADALIGVTVEHRFVSLIPFGQSDCTVVKGIAVKNSK